MNLNNPFAVLRLPANATAAEIKSVGHLALAKLRLGDAGNVVAIRAVESAIEQLRDPVVRFRMGLEWPSLGPVAAAILARDEAFGELATDSRKDRSGAIEQLISGESVIGQQHILAIFHLLRAHGLFACALRKDSSVRDSAQTNDLATASDLFPKAMGLWVAATTSPVFWMAQRLRAKEINDARVSGEVCSACQRESLQIAAQSFATLASEALLARNVPVCTAIIVGIKGCGANSIDSDRILAEIYEPHARKVTNAIQRMHVELEAIPEGATDAYRQVLAQYKSEIDPDMDLMLAIGDLPGSSEERARDAAATFLKTLSVKAAIAAKAFEVSRDAITLAMKVAHSEALRNTLGEVLATVTSLLSWARCVYCQDRVADGEPVAFSMFRVIGREFQRVSYQSVDVPIPRCATCERRHRNWWRVAASAYWGLAILGAIFGGERGGIWGLCGGGVVGAVLGAILIVVLNWLRSFTDRGHPSSYKPIADRIAQGWKKGRGTEVNAHATESRP